MQQDYISQSAPGRHLKVQDVVDLGEHVLVHLVGQVPNGQQEVLHLHVGRLAAEDDISCRRPDVLLVDAAGLVVHPVQSHFHLRESAERGLNNYSGSC